MMWTLYMDLGLRPVIVTLYGRIRLEMTVGMAMLPFAMSAVALSFESVPALTCAGVGSAAVLVDDPVHGSRLVQLHRSTASLLLIALTLGSST